MEKEGPNWEGLLKWSIAHSDGTRSSRQLSEEDKKWFTEAMQSQTVDVVKRMKEITLVMQTPPDVLEAQRVTPEEIQDMLDELQEHVESIDMANDLHSIGGLVPLLGYLKNPHANIRAKAAEVVTTIVQNNPRSQELVMEANGFESLFANFTSDPDINARTQALGALSSLIRNNKPGLAAFRVSNGFNAIADALVSNNVRFQRKALSLLQYLLHEDSSNCKITSELGFPRAILQLTCSEDAALREVAFRTLLEYARAKTDIVNLKRLLGEHIKVLNTMSPEDFEASKEERELVDSIWSTYYNEPSGLVLPGKDAPPPDVASKYFEPPLRALAANGGRNTN